MAEQGQETEAKFHVRDIRKIEQRLRRLKAQRIQARVLEQNVRFDRPDHSLHAAGRVLRLRRDTQARLTYKDSGEWANGAVSRREIEFVVESFDTARQFLEALGYRQVLRYEKYRTTYALQDTQVMLDELPYGNFVEIEGEPEESIRAVAAALALDWEAAAPASYASLFEHVKQARGLRMDNLTFAEFEGVTLTAADLGLRPADE
jgi:adenylate cyclase class 2